MRLLTLTRFTALALATAIVHIDAETSSSRLAELTSGVEGIWSDPPNTPEDQFCFFWCTDAGLARLTALLDDPANDARRYGELRAEAATYQQELYVRARFTEIAARTFPLDPASDPAFLQCEPSGLLQQAFAPHQLQIRHAGDHLEMRYGSWAARRVVYMDGRPLPQDASPTRLGYSVGRYEGDTLVIESTGVLPHRALGASVEVSDQLYVVERYARSTDGARLWLTATVTDPRTFREPIVLKKVWRWAPQAEFVDDVQCERPTEYRTRGR
jgi:hypothetical protein